MLCLCICVKLLSIKSESFFLLTSLLLVNLFCFIATGTAHIITVMSCQNKMLVFFRFLSVGNIGSIILTMKVTSL